jgi:hypothetical protein
MLRVARNYLYRKENRLKISWTILLARRHVSKCVKATSSSIRSPVQWLNSGVNGCVSLTGIGGLASHLQAFGLVRRQAIDKKAPVSLPGPWCCLLNQKSLSG